MKLLPNIEDKVRDMVREEMAPFFDRMNEMSKGIDLVVDRLDRLVDLLEGLERIARRLEVRPK